MKAEGAHELDEEGPETHRAMGGFANSGERGNDGLFGGASATTKNGAMIEQLFSESAVSQVTDKFVKGVDFFRVDAELVENAGPALDATDQ